MAAFGIGVNHSMPGRGGSPGFRFTVYAILSIWLMFLDQRGGWLERARYFLNAAAYPLQLAVNSPAAAWRWLEETFETREALQNENALLREQLREMQLRTMRYDALARENAELRGLAEALPPVAERWLVAEIINVELNSLRQRFLINRGTQNGVFRGQAVMDSKGLLGQTMHVGPWSAEIILLTDPEHAVPVQIERTGVRTIAVGAGDARSLALPYLPANADVRVGDLLITSGLGGVFPQGYPVGRITEVHREAVQPLAQVRATPLAELENRREIMLVWFREGHPAAPSPAPAKEVTAGNPQLQPQPVPPRPQPAPAPTQTPSGTTSSTPAASVPAAGTRAPASTSTGQTQRPAASAPAQTAAPAVTTPAPANTAPAQTPPAADEETE